MKRTEHTQKWLDALRSGEYEQGTRHLYRQGKYCCLGVGLMVIHGQPTEYELLQDNLSLTMEERGSLIRMNDQEGKTFPQIADEIEKMLDVS